MKTTVKWSQLTENAANKLGKMMDGVENHQTPIAKPYGNGYKVDTIPSGNEQAEKSALSGGWLLVK